MAAPHPLTREGRDTLFLLATMAGVVGLLAAHLPWWCWTLTLVVLTWRALGTWRGWPLPGAVWRIGLVAVAAGATFATHRTLLGQEAGVTLIVVLLALKTLELRARRDAFVVFFLGMFTLLTHFFYSQSLLTAAAVLLATWGLLTSLVLAHMPNGRPSVWQAARTAGGMALMGAPIMLALFLFFPRLSPLWGLPTDGKTGRSGLSGTMQVGAMAELAQDTTTALRVRFDGPVPDSSLLYFRGPVLSRFDGRNWEPSAALWPPSRALKAELTVTGNPIRYEVTAEPSNRPWLMLLEVTPTAPTLTERTARMTPDLQWLTDRPLTDLTRYRATSHLSFAHGPAEPVLGLQEHVDLPASFNPRTLALARSWLQGEVNDATLPQRLVQRALDQLRTGGYTYTLAPGVYGTHTADEFWFDRKEGFCEHIASSFVVLMRALDIPARIVTGYQGGEVNPVDGWLTVRQSDAHAWAEVWWQGQGWVRVDPTAYVAPSRIQGPGRLAAPAGTLAGALSRVSPAFIQQLRNNWEALNSSWNQWVLNYSQGRQMDLLRHLGFETPSWQELGYVLAALLGGSTLGLVGWLAWSQRQHDPWLRLLEQARQAATRQGTRIPPQATPRQLLQSLQQQAPPVDQAWVNWLLALEAVRYAPPEAHSSSLRQLQRQWRQLR